MPGSTPSSQLRVVAALLRVVIVDDDVTVLRSFKRALSVRRPTWVVTTTSDVNEALDHLAHQDCDVFVTDYDMPAMNGVDLLQKVYDLSRTVRRVILSGKHENLSEFAPEHLVEAWIRKAWGVDELIAVVEDLIAAGSARKSQPGAL